MPTSFIIWSYRFILIYIECVFVFAVKNYFWKSFIFVLF
jgi:hypothetical protein